MLLLLLATAWIAGLLIGSAETEPVSAWLLAGLASLGLAMLSLQFRVSWRRGVVVGCFAAMLCAAGVWRAGLGTLPADLFTHVQPETEVRLVGVIERDPELLDRNQRIHLRVETLEAGARAQPASGVVLITAPRYPLHHYGERIRVTGALEALPERPAWYHEFLRRQRIDAVMWSFRVESLGEDRWSAFGALLDFRRSLAGSLAAALPEPASVLSQGLLLGLRGGLDDDLLDAFVRTGTSHILAVSGYNVAVVAGIVTLLAIMLVGRARALFLIVPSVAAYAALTGLTPSVTRAAIMGLMLAAAFHVGRQASPLGALMLAAAVMAAVDPLVLWDVGFLLSFMATVGLVALSPPISSWLRERLPGGFRAAVAEGFCAILVAIVATAPIAIAAFGETSLVAPIANLLITPVIPIATIVSAIVALAGLVSADVSVVIGWIAWPFLSYLASVVAGLGSLPFAAIPIRLTDGAVGLYYLGFGGVCLGIGVPDLKFALKSVYARSTSSLASTVRGPVWWPVLGGSGIAVIVIWSAVFAAPPAEVRVWFLDTDGGEAAVLATPTGRTVLIDGGSSPTALLHRLGQIQPFYRQQVDLALITSVRDDRLAGLLDLARRGRIVRAVGPSGNSSPIGREWQRELAESAAEQIVAEPDLRSLVDAGVELEVIAATSPADRPPVAVYRALIGRYAVLFAGALDRADQERLIADAVDVDADVLVIPSYGGRDSLSPAFLDAVRPGAAVIFEPPGRSSGPADETLEQLADIPVFRTDRVGTIVMRFRNEGITVESEY